MSLAHSSAEGCNLHKTDVLLTEKISLSVSSSSDSVSSISHLLSLSCQRFPPLQLIHPHRVHCFHGCAVSRVENLQRATETKYQTMAGEAETSECATNVMKVLLQKKSLS